MPLPTDIDADYPDDPARPGRKIHQQHHDILHAQFNVWEGIDPDDLGVGGGGTHTHPQSEVDALTTALADLAAADSTTTTALAGKAAIDHSTSHGTGGTDEVTVAQGQVSGLIEALNDKASIEQLLYESGLRVSADAAGADALGAHEALTSGVVQVKKYLARCDARSASDLVTTSGSPIVTSASLAFTAADVGKVVSLRTGTTYLTTTVASRQSATQVTLAANAPSTATGGLVVIGTDDSIAVQDAVDAAPEGGTVVIPGQCLVTVAPSVTKHLTLVGSGVAEVTEDIISSSFGSGPSLSPYLSGSVLIQTTAGANGINVTGTGKNVHLRDLGIRFAPAIMFRDTGHGVYAVPTATYGAGGHENGVFNPRWDNVTVFGHDGNHYAFYLLNSNLGTFTQLRGHGGGGLFIESDSYGAGYGNAVFVHPYFRMFCGGSANGFTLKCRDINPTEPSLNLIDFYRPQCNILQPTLAPAFSGLGITAPTIAQYNWRNVRTGTLYPRWINVENPDLENDGVNAFPNDFGGMYSGTTVRNGGIISIPPTGGFSTDNRQNPGLPLSPVIVAGPAVGSGGSVDCRLLLGNDQGGVILLSTGTSPDAAKTVAVTVTCPSMPPTGIKAVFVQGYAYSAGWVKWYIDDIAENSNSFTIRAWDGPLTANYPYQVLFQVIPANTPNVSV